jgi:uncharacterized protein
MKRRLLGAAILGAAMLATPAMAFSAQAHASEGPSFNCAYAKAPDEVVICQSKELSALDREMASLYLWGLDNFKGGFGAYLQHTQRDWLRDRHACGHDVECVGKVYDGRLVEFGDGDIMWSEFCRYHQTDIDCRVRPDGYDPVPRDVSRQMETPNLLQTISAFSWAVGNPVNCVVPEKTYSLQIASGSIVWRNGVGNTDIEAINFNSENQAQTITLHSEHRTGRGETLGTTWSYMKVRPDRVQVTPGGRSSFVLTRCR